MKRKVISALAIAMLITAVTGCAGKQEPQSEVPAIGSSIEASEETENTEEAATAEEASAEVEESVEAEETEDADALASENGEEAEVTEETEDGMTPAFKIVNDMTVGWNLGNTMDAHVDSFASDKDPKKHETSWGNPETTQGLIDAVLATGVNTIRIPITWKFHVDENNNIDAAWMDRVQEIVDYAYGRGAYVIINVHHEDWNYPYYDNKDAASKKISDIWSQISDRFKDYDSHLIFEVQNEPRKVGTDVEWTGGDDEGREVVNAVNMAAYEAIRASEGNNKTRLIMLPGYAASSSTEVLSAIELPENDDCVAVSVHAYTPYDFALNTSGRAEWNNDTQDIVRLMRDLNRMFIAKGTPVIIGEFGALNKNNEEERVEWLDYYLSKADENGIPCIWWDNGAFNSDGENFGIIDRRKLEFPYPGIIDVIEKHAKENQ